MIKLTLSKSKWYRGKIGAKLLDKNGKMCCLGQFAEQCGVSRENLLNRVTYIKEEELGEHLNHGLEKEDYELVKKAMPFFYDGNIFKNFTIATRINDNPATTDAEKIEALQNLLNGHAELEVIE